MKKIGIYYGSTTGVTAGIVDEIEFYLKDNDIEIINVEDGILGIEKFENLILISPTYGVGELQKDWENVAVELRNVDFHGKVIGIIGVGNQYAFGESYVGAMRKLYDIVTENGVRVVGFTSTQGYEYKECEAVIDDEFVGLALDENNQDNQTPDRIKNWIEKIKPLFN